MLKLVIPEALKQEFATVETVWNSTGETRRVETFIAGIKALGVTSVPELLGSRYSELWREIRRIKKYRNKLMHGQVTGQGIKSPQLERDVLWMIEWAGCLAAAAESTHGYDGLRRNTYQAAKATPKMAVAQYPFQTAAELKTWLSDLVKKSSQT